jgi:hypothetical protein
MCAWYPGAAASVVVLAASVVATVVVGEESVESLEHAAMSSAAARTPVQRVVRMDEPYSRRARLQSPFDRPRAHGFAAGHP